MNKKVKNIEAAKEKLLLTYYKGVDTRNKKEIQKVFTDVSWTKNIEIC